MKHLSINLKNSLPTLVSTFLLYGGLNHITLRLRVRCCVAALGAGGLNWSLFKTNSARKYSLGARTILTVR